MANYRGYVCDSCGRLMSREERTEVLTRFQGPVVTGEKTEDKCPECLNPPKQEELRPIRRRKKTV